MIKEENARADRRSQHQALEHSQRLSELNDRHNRQLTDREQQLYERTEDARRFQEQLSTFKNKNRQLEEELYQLQSKNAQTESRLQELTNKCHTLSIKCQAQE